MWELIDQLAQQGVCDFFIGSGSRSTPLVLAAAHHPKIRLHRHLDERSLSFFALGCALAKEAPVALIATSGTAIGNLLPAVMEAHHASIPLILLTADRPPELRDTGANQTTDQIKIFQGFCRWQFDLDSTMPKQAIRSKAAHAVFRALSPQPGPVQINCPLREPLYPLQGPFLEKSPFPLQLGKIVSTQSLDLPAKGIICIGRLPKRSDIGPILALAQKLQWPVFADILSNARLTPTEEQIRRFDWIIGPQAPQPDCILHFGERLTSKRLLEWIGKIRPRYLHISPYPHWFDPGHFVTERIVSDQADFTAESDPSWLKRWKELDFEFDAFDSFTESSAIRSLSHVPLHNHALFLGASMPIREAEWFLFPQQAIGFFSNRGLSGIDGNIATAAGLAAGLNSPVLAIVGDLTALHDLNALSLIKQSKQPITLIISNNQGGGIFSHLSVAKDPRFEELFAFEHHIDFKHAAALFDLPYTRVQSLQELASAFQPTRSNIVELVNSRTENIAFHKHLKELCSSAAASNQA